MAPRTTRTNDTWLSYILAVLAAIAVWVLAVPTVLGTLESYKASAGQPTEGQKWSQDGTLIVFEDHGGSVVRRIGQWKRMQRDGVDIEVRGICASACTMVLDNPKTCSTPDALWMFHRVYLDENRLFTIWGLHNALGWSMENAMSGHYPDGLRVWENAIPEKQDVWILGADLVAAGWVKPCLHITADPNRIVQVRGMADEWNRDGHVQGAALEILLTLPRKTLH